MDDHMLQIFIGGHQYVVVHNTCEDFLLPSPVIIALAIITELMQRIEVSTDGDETFESTGHELFILSFLLKAPHHSKGTSVCQRSEAILSLG